jgi:hypothetical protein
MLPLLPTGGVMPEKHELSFEEFDARVSVEDDGNVWVSFHESNKCAFTITANDLSLVAAFVEKHADIELVDHVC